MKPEISVIIPAWNAGQFIEKTLISIQNQSMEHFEAIIVDGASTDLTADITQSFCVKDPRFKWLSYERCPPGIARNFGLLHSRASFISFCDADDTMDSQMLQILLDGIVAANADIAVCDFDMVYPDKIIRRFSRLLDYEIAINDGNLTEYYYQYCAAPKPNNYVWSRLYRRGFLDCTSVSFGNSRYSEDILFNIMLLCENPRIAHIGKALYQYIQHENSLVRRNVRETNHGKIYLDVFTQACKHLEHVDKPYTEPILAIYAYTRIKSIFFYAGQAGVDNGQTREALDSFLSDEHVRYYLNQCVNMDYLKKYRDIHKLSEDWDNKARRLIQNCLGGNRVIDVVDIF